MNGNEALLEINRIQTQYWGIRETREERYKRMASELVSTDDHPATATLIHCPDCNNGYVRDKSCHCSPNPAGCPDCDYTGYLKTRCELCKGDGWVKMDNEGRLEAIR